MIITVAKWGIMNYENFAQFLKTHASGGDKLWINLAWPNRCHKDSKINIKAGFMVIAIWDKKSLTLWSLQLCSAATEKYCRDFSGITLMNSCKCTSSSISIHELKTISSITIKSFKFPCNISKYISTTNIVNM